jgi:hypothetical protein
MYLNIPKFRKYVPNFTEVLKIGDHVTVVIDETETASLVLVCGIAVN